MSKYLKYTLIPALLFAIVYLSPEGNDDERLKRDINGGQYVEASK